MTRRVLPGLLLATAMWGQTTPPEAVPLTDRALQLPLSGRSSTPGTVVTVQNPLPSGLQSVNTITSTVQVQGAYQGSVPSVTTSGPSFPLSLGEALRRGLQYNLGNIGYQNGIREAQGVSKVVRSELLPNVSSNLLVTEEQISLAALGFTGFPGFNLPAVVGPFHYFDLRAGVAQSVFDLTRLRNYRGAKEEVRSTQFSAQDARDLIVLAVTGGYLQVVTAITRVATVQAQVATAQATYQQAVDRHTAGVAPLIDVTRTEVELKTQQQRLTSVQNDLAKLKIALGRLIGLPPGQEFTLSDTLPFAPLTSITLEQALTNAYLHRADLKAAESQVRAAEMTRKAAVAERYPTVSLAADYGVIGASPASSHGTFAVTGAVRMPIFTGGRIAGDIEQADAALSQRRSEYLDLRGRIDADVRTAFLDLTSAASQVGVAESNRGLAQQTLTQARDRFAAGVADTLEVVQAQETVAAAEQDYISALYAHNVAKATLARALGQADQNIKQFLSIP